jgi:hypothetical protein
MCYFASTRRLAGWLFLIGFAGLTGCQTTDQAHSGQAASVVISGHTEAEIQKATVAAFRANGYVKTDTLTFEKKGSAWETVNYGGWSASRVWIKIRAVVVATDIRKYTLGCDAFAVAGHDDPGMETEQPFLFAKRKECKKILDEVKAALETPPSAAGSRQTP